MPLRIAMRVPFALGVGYLIDAMRPARCSEQVAGPAETTALSGASEPLVEAGSLVSVTHVALSLMLVVAAVLLSAWLLRRIARMQGNALGGLRIIGGLSVGVRERILLLEVGEKQLLVGVAPGYLRTLHVFDEPPIAAGADSSTGVPFRVRLKRALRGTPDHVVR